MAELKDMLNAKLEETLGSQPGVRRECAVCDLFRRQLCEGGCKSFKSVNS
jgi:hypothetical protein